MIHILLISTYIDVKVVPVKKSRHKKYFFEVNFFKSGHEPHF